MDNMGKHENCSAMVMAEERGEGCDQLTHEGVTLAISFDRTRHIADMIIR